MLQFPPQVLLVSSFSPKNGHPEMEGMGNLRGSCISSSDASSQQIEGTCVKFCRCRNSPLEFCENDIAAMLCFIPIDGFEDVACSKLISSADTPYRNKHDSYKQSELLHSMQTEENSSWTSFQVQPMSTCAFQHDRPKCRVSSVLSPDKANKRSDQHSSLTLYSSSFNRENASLLQKIDCKGTERPYKCSRCELRFRKRCNLITHVQIVRTCTRGSRTTARGIYLNV